MRLEDRCALAVLLGMALSGCTRKSASELLARGIERSRAMDHVGAIADFTEVIRLQPDSAEAYGRRGLERSLFTPDFKAAMEDFDTAIRLDPANPQYRYSRGLFRSSQGDDAGAISDLSEALRPELKLPGNEVVRANSFMCRGELFQKRGDLKGAISDFESALKEAPANWPARFRSDTEKALEKARSTH